MFRHDVYIFADIYRINYNEIVLNVTTSKLVCPVAGFIYILYAWTM